jgi:hypothetical protein
MRRYQTAALSVLVLAVASPAARADIIGVTFGGTASPVVRIDPATGVGSAIGPSGFPALNSLAEDRAGTLYSAVDSPPGSPPHLITINPATGAGTMVATLSFGAVVPDVRGLAFSGADVLYAINNTGPVGGQNPDDLFRVDVATGVGTLIGATGRNGVQSITFSAAGILYGWDVGGMDSAGLGLVTIDPATGLATDVNPAVGDGGLLIQGLAFAPDGRLFGVSAAAAAVMPDTLFTIDAATGAASPVGSGGYTDVRGIAFAGAVPEPSAAVLFAAGAVGVLAYARRHRVSGASQKRSDSRVH